MRCRWDAGSGARRPRASPNLTTGTFRRMESCSSSLLFPIWGTDEEHELAIQVSHIFHEAHKVIEHGQAHCPDTSTTQNLQDVGRSINVSWTNIVIPAD